MPHTFAYFALKVLFAFLALDGQQAKYRQRTKQAKAYGCPCFVCLGQRQSAMRNEEKALWKPNRTGEKTKAGSAATLIGASKGA